jgi:hypothetical protein
MQPQEEKLYDYQAEGVDKFGAWVQNTHAEAPSEALISLAMGMGKTRTSEQLAAIARQHGGHVLWGRCYEGEGAPVFWPWVQALRAAVKPLDAGVLRAALGTDAAELAHLVPEIREQIADLPGLEPSESVQARFRQFDSVTRFFGKLAQRGPLLVVLDDLQGADRSSLLLLEFIPQRAPGTRHPRHIFGFRYARILRGTLHVHAMLVRARSHHHVVPPHALVPPDHVGYHGRVRVPDVRQSVGVVNWRCQVILLFALSHRPLLLASNLARHSPHPVP